MSSVWRSVWRWIAAGFAAAVILLGLATGLFRLFTPSLPQYHDDIEAWASEALKVPVTVRSFDLRWNLSGPQLVFSDAALWTPDRSERVLQADSGIVRLSILDLARGKIRPASLMLRGAMISIERDPDGDWRVLGRELPAAGGGEGGSSFLPRGHLELRDATVAVFDGRGAPLFFRGVRLNLDRGSDYLRLDGALDLPAPESGHLATVVQTDAGELERWQLYVRGERLDLALMRRLVPELGNRLRTGQADLTLWSSFHGRRLEEGSLMLDASRIELGDSGAVAARYDRVSGRFGWSRLPGGWRVHGETVQLGRDGHQWPESSFGVDIDDGGAVRTLQADYLRLDDLAPMLAWLPDGELRSRAMALGARGELQDVSFQRVDTGNAVKLSGYFDDLGFEPIAAGPGATGVTGSLRMDEDGGRLELASSHLVMRWPSVFRADLPAAELRGAVSWQRQAQGWRVLSEELLLATEDLRSRVQLELQLPADDTSPVVDLQVAVEDANVAAASRYLPARRMPDRVVQWLDDSLRSGRVVSATASLNGPLRAFPFDGGEGEFRAKLQVEGSTLDYWPGWPAVEGIEGVVEFNDASLSGQIREAQVGGNRVAPALVHIADLREGVIEYTGHSTGDVDDVLGFLRTSGLADRSPLLAHGLESKGASQLDLDFTLPVRHLDATRVRGTLHVDGASVGRTGLRQRLEGVHGAVEYGTDTGLRGDGLNATFLGQPVQVSVSPERVGGGRVVATNVTLAGRFDALDLKAGLDERLGDLIAGSSTYRGVLRLPQDDSPLLVDVRSDLAGTEIRMPAPLAKPADAPLPLHVAARFVEQNRVLVDIGLGDEQRALIETVRGDDGWRFTRGSVELAGGAPRLEEPRGLFVHGHVPALDLDGWLHFEGQGEGDRAEPLLAFLDLDIDELRAFDERFASTHVQVDRNEREWLVQLEGGDLAGSLFVPLDAHGGEPLVARLDRLHLAPAEDGGGDATDPRTLRPMQVEIADFVYSTMRFGELALDLEPIPGGVHVARLATTAPAFNVAGTGEWLATDTGQHSQVDFTLNSTDVEATLDALAFDSALAASEAQVVASVSWPGPPGPHFKEQLAGTVKIQVGKGQLTSVQPGAGRMFGLLSVAALPRRLSLDFRDVFEKGLGFDEIHGDFTLDGGNAFTNNLALEGPAADVGIVGRTGLVARDYDQTAVVYANFGASLPVAGALAAGPAVGAALLIFSEIFKKPLKEMSSTHYRITGSWDDPVVERVAASAGDAASHDAEASPSGEPVAKDQ
jgi:uncharacterized protein (TIGR02099 family)